MEPTTTLQAAPAADARTIRNMPPLILAYIGDAVYELKVREHLLHSGKVKMAELHSAAVAYVNAERQSSLYTQIEPMLTEEERDVFRHARNAKSGHQPPHVAVAAYRRATGVEALIGYLHLLGATDRLELIFTTLFAEHATPAAGA